MGCPDRKLLEMKQRGKAIRYPGVYRVDEGTYWIRAKATDPRTGKPKEIEKLLTGVSAQAAAKRRAEMLQEIRNPIGPARKVRVGEFAKSWIASKALKLDSNTVKTYGDALERHILPALGDHYYETLSSQDVQGWIDGAMMRGWTTGDRVRTGKPDAGTAVTKKSKRVRRAYTKNAIHVWFRVFRTMTRDAIVALDLQRDPTLRVSLPEASFGDAEPNALTPDQLSAFLEAMRKDHPQHFGFVVLLAYTGLRFCHASALRWEDWDEAAGVIRVTRKQVRGQVGPVTRKKQAPKEYPVVPELAEVLRDHRHQLLASQAPGLAEGWMFPSRTGTLRSPSSLKKAWDHCVATAGIGKRFTVHGLRYTFTDLVRLANVDAVVRRALTGHVTEQMQRKYSTVGLAEKRAAVAGVIRLIPPDRNPVSEGGGGSKGGSEPSGSGYGQ
jgi:integrase